MERLTGQQQAGALTIGEGSVGVSELVEEGVGEGPNGCHPGHWAVVQQLGHLQHALGRHRAHQIESKTQEEKKIVRRPGNIQTTSSLAAWSPMVS